MAQQLAARTVTPLTPFQVAQFVQDGYICLPAVLDPDLCACDHSPAVQLSATFHCAINSSRRN
jgi:hypothetical protein|eukprot:COSAG06_NODE_1200_length_10292_cov_59.321201_10_plen_63_part_00